MLARINQLALAGLLCLVSNAQVPLSSPVDGSTPPAYAQGAPAGAYALSGFETVNLFNGGLNFNLPLVSIKGRGASELPLSLAIDRKWIVLNGELSGTNISNFAVSDEDQRYGARPLGYVNPGRLVARTVGRDISPACYEGSYSIYQQTLTRIAFLQSDGTEMEFVDAKTGGNVVNSPHYEEVPGYSPPRFRCPDTATSDRGKVWVTRDGSFATLILPQSIRDSIINNNAPPNTMLPTGFAYLFLKNGTRYKFDGSRLVETRDRNGNTTEYTYDANSSYRFTEMRDSLGRKMSIAYNQSQEIGGRIDKFDVINVPAFGGVSRAVKIHYCRIDGKEVVGETTKDCHDVTGVTPETYAALFSLNGSSAVTFNPRVPTMVELPDGRVYKFQYNVFGELTKVILPTGGAIAYEWGPGPGTYANGLVNVGNAGSYTIYRRVKRRTTYTSSSTIEGSVAYNAYHLPLSEVGGCLETYCTKIEVDTQNAGFALRQRETHYFHGSTAGPDTYFDENYYPSGLQGREFRAEVYKNVASATSTPSQTPIPVKTTETTWQQRSCESASPALEVCPNGLGGNLRSSSIDMRMQKITTILNETSVSTSVETTVFDRYNNPLETQEKEGAAVYRRKVMQYWEQGVGAKSYTRPLESTGVVNEANPSADATVHIRGLVKSESVYDGASSTPTSKTEYGYDEYSGPAGRYASLQSTQAPNLIVDPSRPERGNTTSQKRYLFQLLPTVPTAKELLSNYLYDDAGNVVKVVDPMGRSTTIAYDASYKSAWPTSVTNPASHSVSTSYDPNTGAPTSFTDANSNTYTYSRAGDALDRLKRVNFPDGGMIEYFYCDEGATTGGCEAGMAANSIRKKVLQNSCGTNSVVSDVYYDGLGRTIKQVQMESSASGVIVETQYDFAGRPYKVSAPRRSPATALWTESQYDDAGRLTATVYPDSSAITYLPNGNLLTITDPAGKKRLQTNDAWGRLQAVTEDPAGSLAFTTNYRYSVLDDLLGVCPGAGFTGENCGVPAKARRFTYDSLKRIAKADNPESGEIRYEYNDAGSVTTKTDARGVVITTGFDVLQRPMSKTYSDGTPSVSFVWDTVFKGGLTKVENAVSMTENLVFDAMGRIKGSRQTTNGLAYGFSYEYNVAGGVSKEVYPSGREVSSCYDSAGRMYEVRQKSGPSAAQVTVARVNQFAPHGASEQMSMGNGVSETNAYDPARQQLRRISAASSLSAENWDAKLFYCPGTNDEMSPCATNNGNILQQRSFGNVVSDYSYDSLNRLQQVVEKVSGVPTWHQTFKFDSAGNRWTINDTGTLIPNEMSTPRAALDTDPSPFSAKNQWAGASYDLAGHQTTSWDDGTAVGAAKYFYDAEGKMKRAEVLQSSTAQNIVEYGYDGDGRRVWRKEGSAIKLVYVYDAMGQLAAEYGESPAMPCTSCYITTDHLGSTRVVWGQDGRVKKLYDFAPFGEEVGANYRGSDSRYPTDIYPRASGQSVSMEFTSKERDAETGLDYFEARYLSAPQGRFMSPDLPLLDQHPVNPQSWNLYAYVRNNPLVYVDPTGRVLEISPSATPAELADITARLQRLAPGTTVNSSGTVKGPGFFQRIKNTLTGSGAGTSLVHDLVSSSHTTTITPGTPGDGNAAEPSSGSGSSPSGGTVYIDFSSTGLKVPTHATPIVTASGEPRGPVAMMGRDLTIGLAHELIHALHYTEGSVDRTLSTHRFTSGSNVYEERHRSEELRTVGFQGFTRVGDVTENAIRRQLGYLPRAAYTTSSAWTKIK